MSDPTLLLQSIATSLGRMADAAEEANRLASLADDRLKAKEDLAKDKLRQRESLGRMMRSKPII